MSEYFSKIPDFEYISRLPDAQISEYITVKNLFKKGKLREDIFQNLSIFTKYKIQGNDRPDNVAADFYEDSALDWVILLSNNIININSEWPLEQNVFDAYLIEKYGDYDTLYSGIHHYETLKVMNSDKVVIVPEGLEVSSDFNTSYYDSSLDSLIESTGMTVGITNYEYESKIEDNKRNIFLLKSRYLNIVRDDLEEMMEYKKGSTQYMSETLKRADNIRLFQ